MVLNQKALRRSRNTRGIMIGTARTNPGKDVSHPSPPDRPEMHSACCAPCTRPCLPWGWMP